MSEKFNPSHHSFENPSWNGPATSYDTAPSAPPCYEEATAGANYNLPYPQQPVITNPPIHAVQPASVTPANTHFLVGPQPLRTTCPSCNKHITSRTSTKNDCSRYVCCLLMFFSGVCMLCSCLPFCMCPPVRVNHFCPNCRAFLGTYVDS